MNKLKIKACAKLNLFLDITGRRADGYHELKTVMQTIDLYDELEFTLSDGHGIEIVCDREDVPTDKSNLIYDGIMSVINYASFQPGCKISVRLTKNIPSQAGMGGGSSDCAAAIIAMNKLFRLELSEDELRTAAGMCGADVPFLISGGTALCEGIGERITPLDPIKDIFFAVVKPNDSISTPQAYKLFDSNGKQNAGNYDRFSLALAEGGRSIGKALYNAFTDCCELDSVNGAIGRLKEAGAYGAEMTGSGSAVFGVFDNEDAAKNAVSKADLPFGGVYRPTAYASRLLNL